jgi:hypothetical protein
VRNFILNSGVSRFYLPHMEYEGSIGFVTGKMKKIIADFHYLGLFIAKKHNLSEKKNPSVTRRRRCDTTFSLFQMYILF